jgi:hypothetical protein
MNIDTLSFDPRVGSGLKLGYFDNNTWPWKDLKGALAIHEQGGTAQDPAYVPFIGNIRAYQFDNVQGDEIFVEFHMPHDYVIGSPLFLHTHWSHASATVASGGVEWKAEVTYAKGHDQATFSTPVEIKMIQDASTTAYQHMIAETQLSSDTPEAGVQLDSADLEPDGLLLLRVTLDANTLSDGSHPFLHFVDLHYLSTGIGTMDKAPPFTASTITQMPQLEV